MNKMSLNSQNVFCLLFAIVFTCNLLTAVWSVPLEEYSDLSDDEKRELYLNKLLAENPLFHKRSDSETDPMFQSRVSRAFKSRRAYSRRSGGLSLCLWKVCPAAPWLVSK